MPEQSPEHRGEEQALSKSGQKEKITLYWLDRSRSQRILWLLEELKLEYELKVYHRGSNMLAPKELEEVHPLGKAPIISIEAEGMSKPLVLAESGLIVEYLVDHFGPWLAPKRYMQGKEGQVGGESEAWLRYRYYMHYVEGSLMTYVVVALLVENIRNSPVPFFIKPITKRIAGSLESMFMAPSFKTNFGFLESQLATSPNGGDYLCGKELTGADILMSFPLIAFKGRAGLTKDAYPRMWAYAEWLEGHDGYKKAVQKIINIEGEFKSTL